MNDILTELSALLSVFAPVETGIFRDDAPESYIVLTPLTDSFELFCDNFPEYETQEARISIYSKTNYLKLKNRITKALLNSGFTIALRQFVGFETETGYFHFTIDAQKIYKTEV
jgi:hypothetical protein